MSFGTIGSGHFTISMPATLMPPVRHTTLMSLMPERLMPSVKFSRPVFPVWTSMNCPPPLESYLF